MSVQRLDQVVQEEVPGVGTLVDLRELSVEEGQRAHEVLISRLQRTIARFTPPGTELCQDYSGRPWEHDPSLPMLHLGIKREGKIVGGFYLYNVRAEEETEERLSFRAMFFFGLAAEEVQEGPWRDVMEFAVLPGRLFRWLLENDLTSTEGKVLDLVQWDFPDMGVNFWGEGDSEAEVVNRLMVKDLLDAGHDREDVCPGRIKRVRRHA